MLAVRVWKAPYLSGDAGDVGGFWSAPQLGSNADIQSRVAAIDDDWLKSQMVPTVFHVISLFVGLIGLWGWLLNRERKILFWMAMWSLAGLAMNLLVTLPLPWPSMVSVALTQPLFSLTDISVWFVLIYLLEMEGRSALLRWIKRLAWLAFTIQCLDGMLIPLTWASSHVLAGQVADFVLTLIYTVLEATPLVLIFLAIRRQHSRARWLVAGSGRGVSAYGRVQQRGEPGSALYASASWGGAGTAAERRIHSAADRDDLCGVEVLLRAA